MNDGEILRIEKLRVKKQSQQGIVALTKLLDHNFISTNLPAAIPTVEFVIVSRNAGYFLRNANLRSSGHFCLFGVVA